MEEINPLQLYHVDINFVVDQLLDVQCFILLYGVQYRNQMINGILFLGDDAEY